MASRTAESWCSAAPTESNAQQDRGDTKPAEKILQQMTDTFLLYYEDPGEESCPSHQQSQAGLLPFRVFRGGEGCEVTAEPRQSAIGPNSKATTALGSPAK